MKLQPAVKKEVLHIVCGVAVCTVMMWVVFAILGLFTSVKLDASVLLGGILGSAVAMGNFVAMCLTVQKIASGDPKQAKGWMQISYNARLFLQAVWCIVAMQVAGIHFIAGALPLLFPRITIMYLQKIGAYKPEVSTNNKEVVDPEGVFAREDEGGET